MQLNEIKRTRKAYESVILTVTGKNRGQTTVCYERFERWRRYHRTYGTSNDLTTYTMINWN